MRIFLATAVSTAALGLAACTTVTTTAPAPSASAPRTSAPSSPSRTTAPGSSTPSSAPPPGPVTVPNVTSPWAVVSAYYADIESGNYPQAWALIGGGATTGQSYQQFVAGYACTGAQQLTELGASGDQVSFDLSATNSCTGQVQTYTGTDTVQNGVIVAADVTQTG